MILPGERITRDMAIFVVSYDFRAPLPRPVDWAGDSTGPSPGFEGGLTPVFLNILAESVTAAEDFVERRFGHEKDFALKGSEVCPVQLDWAVPAAVHGGRI